MATGRFDAIAFLLGVGGGIFIYGEAYPMLADFTKSTAMGRMTLPEFFNLPYGVIVFAVILMAVGCFAGATWVEKKFGGPVS